MKKFKELIHELDETTKWKKGDGRPRKGSHIENIKFWDLPDASLKYIMKDASAAVKANPDGKKAGKYADEVNDAATVLFWRKQNKIVVEEVVNEAKDMEGNKLSIGDIVFFKSDIEQYGKITKIKGNELTLAPDKMMGGKFIGDTIGGDKVTTMDSGDVFKESVELEEADELKGWIAIFNGKKLEIVLDKDADSLYGAKKFAIKHFKVPKSKMGLLAIEPAY
jgi:hypothetical protein